MAQMGAVHKPGMAAEMMREIAPLLADEGIDLDDLDEVDLDAFNAALARATERRNVELFTPTGVHRAISLTTLRLFSEAIAEGGTELARAILGGIQPEPDGDTPAISHVIGVGLGVLDGWHTGAEGRVALEAARVPGWHDKRSRSAGTDILSLAQKGRAFDALESLHRRHSGPAIFEGTALAVAATMIAWATRENVPVRDLVGRELTNDTPAAPAPTRAAGEGSAFGLSSTAAPTTPRLAPVTPIAASARRTAPPSSKKRKNRSGHPARRATPPADRLALREFTAWLEVQPMIAAPTVAEETAMLEALFALARSVDLDANDPADIDLLLDVLLGEDDPDVADATQNALFTLDDYVHFRLDTADDREEWEEAHGILEETLDESAPASDAIAHALEATASIDAEERRAALARTRIVAAVGGLLQWIGSGQPVAPSGGVRRADIAHVAAMLDITAIGVSKRPALEPDDLSPLFDDDAPLPAPTTIHALSMYEVGVLAAWWEALRAAELLERKATRVRLGPAAERWTAERMPPLDLAEMVASIFVAEVLLGELERGYGSLHDPIFAETMRRLLRAVAPELDRDDDADTDDDEFADLWARRARLTLGDLHHAGLLEPDDAGVWVVPVALRGAVAQGIVLALAAISGDDDFGE